MAQAQRPTTDSVKVFGHWQAGGVTGHGWDVFFGDGTHRAFDDEKPARDAATRWGKAHRVSVWITETKGTEWRLLPNVKSSSSG